MVCQGTPEMAGSIPQSRFMLGFAYVGRTMANARAAPGALI
jgi:hypothetical protein